MLIRAERYDEALDIFQAIGTHATAFPWTYHGDAHTEFLEFREGVCTEIARRVPFFSTPPRPTGPVPCLDPADAALRRDRHGPAGQPVIVLFRFLFFFSAVTPFGGTSGPGECKEMVGPQTRQAEREKTAGPAPLPGPVGSSLLRAWPALAGYALARMFGTVMLLIWTGSDPIRMLASRYDTGAYLHIAERGYAGSCPVQGELCRYAFFPLYPGLIRGATAVLPLPASWAAWGISVLASLVAAWGIYAVVEMVANRATAIVLVVLWGVLPHAVVESMAYTEPLFTALAAWALYAVLTRRWLTAGGLAVLAGLTRPSGAAVAATVVVCALTALLRPGPGGQRPVVRLLVCVLVAPLGWLAWVGWVGHRAGRWDGYFRVQERWGTSFDGGAFTLQHLSGVFQQPMVTLDAVMVAAAIAAAVVLLVVCCIQRQPAPLLVYATALVIITIGVAGYFHSKARFLIPAFVLLLPVARALSRARPTIVWTVLASATVISAACGYYLLGVARHSP
ncbi:hypothetical protein GCM10020367_22370 [Streptomyces sannanensis]|uniref:Glycosyltransferase RgtA/B/C/D-like domain-containing protein n=1 Tax=Streptomyces sannanensis TaxID=285536 RepID=A0ABP6SAM1_9ACTN